jgi:hypothetical protein
VEELADAVVYWIAYRRCLGVDRYLDEGSFKEPVIGYLQADGWTLETEQDYWSVCDTVKRGKCFSDYSLSKQGQKLLLETKFFKTSSQNGVFNDFVKLALPLGNVVKCCELIVWSKSKPPWGPFELLRTLEVGEKIILDPAQALLTGRGKVFPLKDNVAEFARLSALGSPMNTIDVHCTEKADSKGYGGMVIAISRSSTPGE